MKTKKILLFGMILSILTFTSCSKDSEPTTTEASVTSNDVAANQNMDDAIDDVSLIADDQYEVSEGSTTGRIVGTYYSILPDCATVSDAGSTTSIRVLTITFGNPNTPACKFRGRYLKGQIILTRTKGTTFPKVMTVTFNNFYVNENKLEGTSTWKREMLESGGTLRPKTTFTMNGMKLTTTSGVHTRNGELIREMTAGFSTRENKFDDVYSTYGEFTTTHPNGSLNALIAAATPLVHKTACSLQTNPAPYPVSGILKLSKNSHYATINYGAGECDHMAMLSIDGGTPTEIHLGN
jgi:hypothetical protein